MTRSRPTRRRRSRGRSLVGERYDVRTGRVGHGGFVVARHEGVVVFVRHALPDERVIVEVTEGNDGDRFLRADAVEVLEGSPDRVAAPCPYAGPGRCGGCDWQHVAVPAQRELKAAVVAEQLARLAGLSVDVHVEAVDPDALGWRTRVQWAVAPDGRLGLRRHRSHEVVDVDRCRIAHPDVAVPPEVEPGAFDPGVEEAETLRSGTGELLTLVTTRDERTYADGPVTLHERAAGRTWQVSGSGFWQVHPAAADVLAAAVGDGVRARPGERVVDLYSGVGLFAGVLAEVVGVDGSVVAVESDEVAAQDAADNLAHLPQVSVLAARVDRALASGDLGGADVVVLDPPRSGARREVVDGIAALRPRVVAYVACDPAALARDTAYLLEAGFELSSVRAFDLFPMTHHVECVAVLEKAR